MIPAGNAFTRFTLLIAALFLCSSVGVARAADPELREVLDQAAVHYRAMEYEKARDLYRKATEIDPGELRAWRGLGWSHWSLDDRGEALAIWNQLLKIDPNDVSTLLALAYAREERKEYEESLELFSKVLDVEPGRREGHLGRARILEQKGRISQAAADLRAVLENDPRDPDAGLALAEIELRRGRRSDAGFLVRRVAASNPGPRYDRHLAGLLVRLGEVQESISRYRRAYRENPNHRSTALGLAYAYSQDQQYDEAVAITERFVRSHPRDDDARKTLADFHAAQGDWNAAERELELLVDRRPEDLDVRMELAHVVYKTGRYPEAIGIAQGVLERDPAHPAALALVADDAQSRGDEEMAIRGLEELLSVEPSASRWIQLAQLHLDRGNRFRRDGFESRARSEYELSTRAFRSAAEIDPTNPDAVLGVVTATRLGESPHKAIEVAQTLFEKAPALERVRRELYLAHHQIEDYATASNYLRINLESFPNNTNLTQLYARSLFASGEERQSIRVLENLLDQPLQPTIPILLYHGLSDARRQSAMAIADFRDQLTALKREGYESIDAHQLVRALSGDASELPKKPVFITFDDARADSFRNADPILDELGFTATMFVPTGEIGGRGAYHSSWRTMRELKATGRWDFQCHGDEAHAPIPIDGDGNVGAFLANRMWLEDEGRLETPEEFVARIDEDYRDCREILESEIPGTRAITYAYPFGDLGQKSMTNYPPAFELNQKLAMKYHERGFIQDVAEQATPISPRALTPRYEVPNGTTGEELVQYLREFRPIVNLRFALADLYAWSGRYDKAAAEYDQLAALGVPKSVVLAKKGQMHVWSGDFAAARPQLAAAQRENPDSKSVVRSLDTLEKQLSPRVELDSNLYEDSNDRRAFGAGPSMRVHLTDRFSVQPRYRFLRFEHDQVRLNGSPAQDIAAFGHRADVEAKYAWDYRNSIAARGGAAIFEEDSQANGSERPERSERLDPIPVGEVVASFGPARWLDVELSGERNYVDTAGAVLAERTFAGGSGELKIRPIDRIEVLGRQTMRDYDDGNQRSTTMVRAMTDVWEEPGIRVGFQHTRDDSDRQDPLYYTPDEYVGNDGVVSLQLAPVENVALSLWATAGVGTERERDGEMQTSVSGDARFSLTDRFGLVVGGGRGQAASFDSVSGYAGLFGIF